MSVARLPSENNAKRLRSISPALSKTVSRSTSGAYEDPDPYSEKPNSRVLRQLSISETDILSRQLSFADDLTASPSLSMLKGNGKGKSFLSPVNTISKRWSAMYVNRVHFTQDLASTSRRQETNALINVISCVMLLKRAAKRFLRRLHQKLSFAKLSYKKQTSIEHFQWAPPAQEWSSSWGRNLHCCVCRKPVISDSSHCRFCGVISHRLCILGQIRANAVNAPPKNPGEHAALTLAKYFTCTKCSRFQAEEETFYNSSFEVLKAQRTKDYYRNIISVGIVDCIQRKRAKKKGRALSLLRSAMNRFFLVKQYKAWRRSCLRVIVLDLSGLPSECMNDRCLVVLTVVDPLKHSQLFRIDKKPDVVVSEGILFLRMVLCYSIVTMS